MRKSEGRNRHGDPARPSQTSRCSASGVYRKVFATLGSGKVVTVGLTAETGDTGTSGVSIVSERGLGYLYFPNRLLGVPGTYGTVFEAVTTGGQAVAVKIVSVGDRAEDAQLAERELTIGRAIPALPGSHLLPLLDVARRQGQLILVMPRARRSLADLIDGEGPLTPDVTIEIMSQIATGLRSLAAAGVLHRDVKPANVLELDGRWHLADFGISRLVTAATAAYTWRGGGTSEYRAPELFGGEPEKTATDLYALGCIGYELLTGQKAFPGPDFRGQHIGDVPVLPAGIPAVLRTVVLDLLAKQPSLRPPDARSVAEALRPRPHLSRGQLGLQAMRSHAAQARLTRQAQVLRANEHADRREQAQLRWSYLWRTVLTQATTAVADAEAGQAAGGEPYLLVGDARLLIRLQPPRNTLSPLLMVGQLVATLRDHPGDAIPANLACLWTGGQAEWLLLRTATTPGHGKMLGIGVDVSKIEWVGGELRVAGTAPASQQAATADLILELFTEAISVDD
jgi:hypothetical protein